MWNCFLMGLCHTLRNEVQAKLILDNELSRDFISFDFQCSKPLTNRETSVVRWHPITVILTNPILVWEWFQPNIEHWVVDHPPEASMIKKGSLPFSRSTCPMSVLKTLTVSRLSDSRVWDRQDVLGQSNHRPTFFLAVYQTKDSSWMSLSHSPFQINPWTYLGRDLRPLCDGPRLVGLCTNWWPKHAPSCKLWYLTWGKKMN